MLRVCEQLKSVHQLAPAIETPKRQHTSTKTIWCEWVINKGPLPMITVVQACSSLPFSTCESETRHRICGARTTWTRRYFQWERARICSREAMELLTYLTMRWARHTIQLVWKEILKRPEELAILILKMNSLAKTSLTKPTLTKHLLSSQRIHNKTISLSQLTPQPSDALSSSSKASSMQTTAKVQAVLKWFRVHQRLRSIIRQTVMWSPRTCWSTITLWTLWCSHLRIIIFWPGHKNLAQG